MCVTQLHFLGKYTTTTRQNIPSFIRFFSRPQPSILIYVISLGHLCTNHLLHGRRAESQYSWCHRVTTNRVSKCNDDTKFEKCEEPKNINSTSFVDTWAHRSQSLSLGPLCHPKLTLLLRQLHPHGSISNCCSKHIQLRVQQKDRKGEIVA